MEEVPQAPEPVVPGMVVRSFILDNSTLDRGDGFGESQMRKRRFSFGWRHSEEPPDLRRWMMFAALELPNPSLAVTYSAREIPVMIGGSGKVKASAVTAHADEGHRIPERIRHRVKEKAVIGDNDQGRRPMRKERAVVAREATGGISEEKLAWQRENKRSGLAPGNHRKRTWAECCALQGLPADFLSEAPFTVAGKFQALGNGVPLPMGRAIARAIKGGDGLRTGC